LPEGELSNPPSLLGILIGRKVGEILGRWAGVLGGLILIGIGMRVLVEHLFRLNRTVSSSFYGYSPIINR
jgi:hypothetical protein